MAVVVAAAVAGGREAAERIGGWDLPAETDRQFVLAIPARPETPAGISTAEARAAWDAFLALRRRRADAVFRLATAAIDGPGRTPPDRPWPAASWGLLHRVLRDDPDHAAARALLGWVRRGEAWVRAAAAARLDRGEEHDPAFGWLPPGRLARYRAGERCDRGRWMTAAEDDARRPAVADGRRFDTDHWEILSAAPLAAAALLGGRLEETHEAWRQVFGGSAAATQPDRLAAVLCADRAQFTAELLPLEPAAGRSSGLYWLPTRTAWFVAAGGPAEEFTATVRHEATHQLFLESAGTQPRAGEDCGFWAIEAAACHLESLRPAAFGWTVGGPDAGRVPEARRLLLEEEFHVPLAELCALGRAEFQADRRLPGLYDEAAGLADFLLNGGGGRHRDAFRGYLARVYAGTAEPDTLARLCGTTYAALDEAYRRHLSR